MKQLFLKKALRFITSYKHYTDEEIDKLRYGLEGLYLSITKLIVISILAIFLGIFKELCILLVLFNIVRFPGFGFHANKSYECLICSTLLFIGLPLFMKYFPPDTITLSIIGIICTVILGIYAPADTAKRPLPNARKRRFRKIATICISCIYTFIPLIFPNNDIYYLFITALMLEAIMVSPLLYIFFKQPYRNYLAYQKA